MRTTTGTTRRPPAGLRTVQICENYQVVAELQAFNLRDGLNRFLRERPWLENPLIVGNVATVDDEGAAREFYSKDPSLSGGSFDYLFSKLEDWRDGLEDGWRMAARLEECGCQEAADELTAFMSRRLPVDLIELIRVIEWHDSADYGFDQVIRANAEYLASRTQVPG